MGRTITSDRLCALTGFTERHHLDLAKAGHFPPPVKGVYQDEDATLRGVFSYIKLQLAKKTDTLAAADLRLKNARADMAEEQLSAFKQLYVLKSEIGPALRNLSSRQRDALQYKLEQEIAPSIEGKKPVEILLTMQAATDSICQIFENGVRGWLDDK